MFEPALKKAKSEVLLCDSPSTSNAVEHFRLRSEFWHRVRYAFLLISGVSLVFAIPVFVAAFVITFKFDAIIPGFGKGFMFGTSFQPHERGTLTDVPINIFDLMINRASIFPFNQSMFTALYIAISGASLFFLCIWSFIVYLSLFVWYRLFSNAQFFETTSGHVFRL